MNRGDNMFMCIESLGAYVKEQEEQNESTEDHER